MVGRAFNVLKILTKIGFNRPVAYPPARPILRGKCFKGTCTLCSAAAYCCGAVAPRAIAALLGRFLPRLGPLVHSSGPFFFVVLRSQPRLFDRSSASIAQRKLLGRCLERTEIAEANAREC